MVYAGVICCSIMAVQLRNCEHPKLRQSSLRTPCLVFSYYLLVYHLHTMFVSLIKKFIVYSNNHVYPLRPRVCVPACMLAQVWACVTGGDEKRRIPNN